jgi:hypothetical protein
MGSGGGVKRIQSFSGKTQWKRQLGRIILKCILKVIEYDDDWLQVAQYKVHLWELVNAIMNL